MVDDLRLRVETLNPAYLDSVKTKLSALIATLNEVLRGFLCTISVSINNCSSVRRQEEQASHGRARGEDQQALRSGSQVGFHLHAHSVAGEAPPVAFEASRARCAFALTSRSFSTHRTFSRSVLGAAQRNVRAEAARGEEARKRPDDAFRAEKGHGKARHRL